MLDQEMGLKQHCAGIRPHSSMVYAIRRPAGHGSMPRSPWSSATAGTSSATLGCPSPCPNALMARGAPTHRPRSLCPTHGATGEPKVSWRSRCPTAVMGSGKCSCKWGIETAAPSRAQESLDTPWLIRYPTPHRCRCQQCSKVLSVTAVGCPLSPSRGGTKTWKRVVPRLEVWGVLHGAGKDLAPLRLLLTAAFHVSPVRFPRPSFPPPQFLFWVLLLVKLKFSHPDPSPALGSQLAPDLLQAYTDPRSPGAQPSSPNCWSQAPMGQHSPSMGG